MESPAALDEGAAEHRHHVVEQDEGRRVAVLPDLVDRVVVDANTRLLGELFLQVLHELARKREVMIADPGWV